MSAIVGSNGNSDVIDWVARDPRTDDYVVAMVQPFRWTNSRHELELLERKIDTYVTFVLLGKLVESFPAASGKRVRIQLDCMNSPTGHVADLLVRAQRGLATRGIGFSVNVLSDSPAKVR